MTALSKLSLLDLPCEACGQVYTVECDAKEEGLCPLCKSKSDPDISGFPDVPTDLK